MRAAFSTHEMMLVLLILGLLAAVGLPRAARQLDRIHARGAAAEVVSVLATARHAAIRQGRRTAVRFDRPRARVTVHAGSDTLLVRPLAGTHRVTLAATRDSLAYRADGLGFGAANTSIVVRRGAAAETVVVSRLGRVRW